MVYQPIVNLADLSVVGHEALLRVAGPGGCLRTAGGLIVAAERCEETFELDRKVAALVLSDAGCLPGMVHLNVSACTAQRHGSEMVSCLEHLSSLGGLPAARLRVEVTETAPVTDLAAITDFADGLHALGIEVCADDIGDGSLQPEHLGKVAWDVVKLPSGLLCRYREDPSARSKTLSLLSAAADHHLVSIVEGVRDLEAGRKLCENGADYAQAFLYGRPARLDLAARRSAA